jgi:ABC-2 type transport system permease protein
MDKFWQIVKYEYTRHVFRKRFIMTVLSLPLMIIGIVGLVLLISYFMVDRAPIGYVDQSSALSPTIVNQTKGNFFEPALQMIPFTAPEDASRAMADGEIQAYFILPADFETSRIAKVYFEESLGSEATGQIDSFLRTNLLAGETLQYEERLTAGTSFLLRAADGSREIHETEWANVLIPFMIGLIFVIVVMTSGGYLLQAVVEEKENRTMEIMITSVSPMQLMAGKIIGNLSVGLTQLLIWGLFTWLSLAIAGKYVPFIADLHLSGEYMLLNLALMLPAFVFVAAMMATLGATVTESQEAQQVSGLFTLPIMLPYYFMSSIMLHPDGPIAKFLSYFPLSAPVALSMRMAFTIVPTWEVILIITILIAFSIFTVWLAGRAFRIGMLSYGKRISLRQLFQREVSHV